MDIYGKYVGEDNFAIEVRSPGRWNNEAGPDFKNASLVIDGKPVTGDVEIHLKASDWFAHNHHNDQNYDRVVLHVVAKNDFSDERRDELPPMLCLSCTDNTDFDSFAKCAALYNRMGTERTGRMLVNAGLKRYEDKKRAILRSMLEQGAENGCWKTLFDAAGFKRNRREFAELFDRLCCYPFETINDSFEIVIWGESGLLPDLSVEQLQPEMNSYADAVWKKWWKTRWTANKEIKWSSGGRPSNSPYRRIAVIISWYKAFATKPINLLGRFAMDSSAEQLAKQAVKLLETSDALWDGYINFKTCSSRKARIAGRSFALETAVNVLLPALGAAAEVGYFGEANKWKIADIACNAWKCLPSTQHNYITKEAGLKWFPDKEFRNKVMASAAARQGVLHMYREYCEKACFDCNSCVFINSFWMC
ncbi:MAG: DUF2851 family protein [Lentisphaerae bacterium]|nr:DUF2851 family protein [Lentisphaerota bacterium]MCP4103704.1 DUF2851 family protein [Lentisphaerota bacterium]